MSWNSRKGGLAIAEISTWIHYDNHPLWGAKSREIPKPPNGVEHGSVLSGL